MGHLGQRFGCGDVAGDVDTVPARAEYLHLDLVDQSFGNVTPMGTSTFLIKEGQLTADAVRLGLNYHFK
jgi:hypothetical protein